MFEKSQPFVRNEFHMGVERKEAYATLTLDVSLILPKKMSYYYVTNVRKLQKISYQIISIGNYNCKVRTTYAIFLMSVNSFVNPFPNKSWLLHVCSTSLLKTLREKEKLLLISNFSFSHSVFYPFEELCTIFINFKIVVCKHSQFGRV